MSLSTVVSPSGGALKELEVLENAMVTLVKGKVAENVADGERARPAAAAQRVARGAPTRQAPGLVVWFMELVKSLDAMLAGPAMTDRERARRQASEYRAERDYGLQIP